MHFHPSLSSSAYLGGPCCLRRLSSWCRLAGCNKGAGRGCPSLSIRAAAQRHSEEDWQRELSAGSTRSRAAQLNYARVQVPTAGPSQGSSMLKGLEEAAPAAVQDAAAAAPRAPAWLSRWLEKWETLPARYRFVVATSLAFVVCNMVSTRSVQAVQYSGVYWQVVKLHKTVITRSCSYAFAAHYSLTQGYSAQGHFVPWYRQGALLSLQLVASASSLCPPVPSLATWSRRPYLVRA